MVLRTLNHILKESEGLERYNRRKIILFWSHVIQRCEQLNIEPVASREETNLPEGRVGGREEG